MIFVPYHKPTHKCTISSFLEEEKQRSFVSKENLSAKKKKKNKSKRTHTQKIKNYTPSVSKQNSQNVHRHTHIRAHTHTKHTHKNTNTKATKSYKGALVGRYLVVTYLPR